jgi:hypothetical protein
MDEREKDRKREREIDSTVARNTLHRPRDTETESERMENDSPSTEYKCKQRGSYTHIDKADFKLKLVRRIMKVTIH